MKALVPTILGLIVLLVAWSGPLIERIGVSFAAHMAAHVLVVAVAAPLLAAGLAVPAARVPGLQRLLRAPILAGLVELVVIWGWHTPFAHNLARISASAFAVEQLMFLLSGFVVWASALGTARGENRQGALVGALALLMTSMHMTLLGALIAVSPRTLYICGAPGTQPFGLTALDDQYLGAVGMLFAGGLSYLIGGLVLVARLLREPEADRTAANRHGAAL